MSQSFFKPISRNKKQLRQQGTCSRTDEKLPRIRHKFLDKVFIFSKKIKTLPGECYAKLCPSVKPGKFFNQKLYRQVVFLGFPTRYAKALLRLDPEQKNHHFDAFS